MISGKLLGLLSSQIIHTLSTTNHFNPPTLMVRITHLTVYFLSGFFYKNLKELFF